MVKNWHVNLMIVGAISVVVYVLLRSSDARYLAGLVLVLCVYNLVTVLISSNVNALEGLYPFLALNAALLPLLVLLLLPDVGSVKQLVLTIVDLRDLAIPILISYGVVAALGDRSLVQMFGG